MIDWRGALALVTSTGFTAQGNRGVPLEYRNAKPKTKTTMDNIHIYWQRNKNYHQVIQEYRHTNCI
jgi:hypothetical protein